MGKGQIISGGTGGEYQVKILYNRDRYDAMITALNAKKTELTENRVPVQSERDDKSVEVNAVIVELNILIDELKELYIDLENLQIQLAALRVQLTILEGELKDLQEQQPPPPPGTIEAKQAQIAEQLILISDKQTEISDKEKDITEKQTEVEDKQLEANTLTFELAILDQQLAEIDLQITSIEKKIQYLEGNMPADETVSAWCADLTEDLSGYVGTVEIPGERIGDYGSLQIQPGHELNAAYDSDRDGQLFPTIAVTAAQAFYNAAMLPGWQKWKPLFRHGTITAIADSLASVALDATVKSSQQDLIINQATILTGVAFEYMSCDGNAFAVDDEVLIMFTGQDFAHPKIIGFKTDPVECCSYVENFTDGTYDINWSGISNPEYIAFEQREEFVNRDDEFYIDMNPVTSYTIIRDTRYNEDHYLETLHPNMNVTIHFSIDNISWNGDGYFYVLLYGGTSDLVEDIEGDYGHVYLVLAPMGLIPDELEGQNTVNLADVETEADGRYKIDLSQEPYPAYLKGSIRAGTSFGIRVGSVEVNAFKFCVNAGEYPIIPPIE